MPDPGISPSAIASSIQSGGSVTSPTCPPAPGRSKSVFGPQPRLSNSASSSSSPLENSLETFFSKASTVSVGSSCRFFGRSAERSAGRSGPPVPSVMGGTRSRRYLNPSLTSRAASLKLPLALVSPALRYAEHRVHLREVHLSGACHCRHDQVADQLDLVAQAKSVRSASALSITAAYRCVMGHPVSRGGLYLPRTKDGPHGLCRVLHGRCAAESGDRAPQLGRPPSSGRSEGAPDVAAQHCLEELDRFAQLEWLEHCAAAERPEESRSAGRGRCAAPRTISRSGYAARQG